MPRNAKRSGASLEQKSSQCLTSLEKTEELLGSLVAAVQSGATLPAVTVDKIVARVIRLGASLESLTHPAETKPPVPGATPEDGNGDAA
jgi:hypothetical protein